MENVAATDQLIAQLLAQGRHDAYEHSDTSEDQQPASSQSSDGNNGRPRRAGATSRKRPRSKAPGDSCLPPEPGLDDRQHKGAGAAGEAGRRRRSDTGKQRAAGRPWTDQEECLFLQALEQHGRDWKACADLIGSRDADAIKSHAQRHFIKLCLRGKMLPVKVAESGQGYTLSGNPLDPVSAGAIQNGFKVELLAKLSADELEVAKAGLDVSKLPVLQGCTGAETQPETAGNGESHDQAKNKQVHKGKRPPRSKKKAKGSTRRASPDAATMPGGQDSAGGGSDPGQPAQSAPEPRQRTEYALSRPRRQLARQQLALAATTESSLLVQPLEFIGQPGSGAPLAQPFHMTVHAQALAVADFQAHLSNNEIIGLLGGSWDEQARHLTLLEAYPCRCLEGAEAANAVELDPVAEVEVRSAMEAAGQRCVGWYHSHPVFEPRPSQKDMENQRNYQALFRDSHANEPFVGLIIGPYDVAMLGPTSAITAFLVQQRSSSLVPYELRYSVTGASQLLEQGLGAKLDAVLQLFDNDPSRADLSQQWRPYTSVRDGQPAGPPLTKMQVLQASLAQFLRDAVDVGQVQEWVASVGKEVEKRWHGIKGTAEPSEL